MKKLRIARVAVALIVFVLMGAQFLDVYHALPKLYYKLDVADTQFVPSLIMWLGGGAVVSAAAFVAFCVCALLFGRAYCSFFCAFGILMDVLRKIFSLVFGRKFFAKSAAGKFAKSAFSMQYRRSRAAVRGFFLALATVCIIFGWVALLGFLDPYSLYGKVFGAFVNPIFAGLCDLSSTLLYGFDIYAVPPVNGNPQVPFAAFGAALLILLGISAASVLRGRLFCNTVCPVGALLGLLSKFALFKLGIDAQKCVSCGKCERICKAECADAKNKRIDFSKCVLCFDCAPNCPKKAIGFSVNNLYKKSAVVKKQPKLSENNCAVRAESGALGGSISRRKFPSALLGVSLAAFFGAKIDAAEKNASNISRFSLAGRRADKCLTAPPGARSIENFLGKCTACQRCVAACKAQILKPSVGQWGLSHFMQPFMDYDAGFCLFDCHSCSKVCPTDAIGFIALAQKRRTKIGTAIFNENLCVVKTDGTDCAACGEHCPVQAIEMLPFDRKKSLYIPHVHSEVCIGCGACESICPVRPHRAIVIEGLAVHSVSKVFDSSMRVSKPDYEAPQPQNSSPFPF